MSECKHEWLWMGSILNYKYACKHCPAILTPVMSQSMLNAIENLLSHPCHCDDAFTGRDMHSTACPWYHLEWAFGKSKEDILEGK